MTEVNEDVNGAIENNEQEMIDEGAPVDPSTDPVIHGDSDPAGTNEQDDNAEATEGAEATEATEGAEAPEAEGAEAAEGVEAQDAEATSDFDAEYRKRLREYTRELKKQPGEWYIIQSYSGYENKVKTNLEMRSQTLEVEDSIYEVVVPVEQALEKNKDGKNKLVKRKLLPGYVLVRMDMNDAAWSVVRETPGVTSFVGNEGNATPVKHRDVAKFLLPKSAAAGAKPQVDAEGDTVVPSAEETPNKVTHDYKVGEAVTILSGALASVSATINAIDPETGKIEALVSIFGRETPVELTADQIERIM
ncbi:transcription termination/antitermination protein NusG [Corynebacterium coyleae]|uniref:transcription termination/antitermination protein NusG n=1 Tax=Corynebacterium coyleae TaxID=53374 RepID=UPI00254D821F|nr:transcription termination/antitermination protein NusG [Corynebacterium coyleae]MDK6493301.1 transcription termination/antitermination protein NusG [Corynebacterium coyleae]